MEKNLDMSWGVTSDDPNNRPNWYKTFMLLSTKDKKIVTHECLYEGISSYLKTEDHLIIGQIHIRDKVHHGIEGTPNQNPYIRSTPRIKLSDGQRIWRYISLNKFEDLINSSKLYFARIDRFNDNLEGISPESCRKAIISDGSDKAKQEETLKYYEERLLNNRKISFACCWHINDNINYSIWDEYGKGSVESIAIQTNFKKLNSEIRKSRVPIINEPIRYFENPFFNQEAYWFPTFFKRNEYSHESELRSILFMPNNLNLGSIKIDVNLEKLISKIFVHPKSDKNHLIKIKRLVKDKGLNIQVVKRTKDI